MTNLIGRLRKPHTPAEPSQHVICARVLLLYSVLAPHMPVCIFFKVPVERSSCYAPGKHITSPLVPTDKKQIHGSVYGRQKLAGRVIGDTMCE